MNGVLYGSKLIMKLIGRRRSVGRNLGWDTEDKLEGGMCVEC